MKANQVEYVVFEEPDTLRNEKAFVNSFIEAHPNVDGVFALTDMLANLLIETYQIKGVRIPEDVQIIGFDGIQYFNPRDALSFNDPAAG